MRPGAIRRVFFLIEGALMTTTAVPETKAASVLRLLADKLAPKRLDEYLVGC